MRFILIILIIIAVIISSGGCGDLESNIVNPTDQEEPIPAVKAAFDFLEQNYPYMITYPNDMKVRRADQDPNGWWHVRLIQYYKDLKVLHAESIVHMKPDLTVQWFDPTFYEDIDIDTSPEVSLNDAVAIAVAHQELIGEHGINPEEAELLIYPRDSNLCLSWFFYLAGEDPPCHWHYYVNAVSGEIIYYWDGIIVN